MTYSFSLLPQIYTREVAFDGGPESYLSYTYLKLVTPTNSPPGEEGGASANGARLVSFSVVAASGDGVLLMSLNRVRNLALYNNTCMILFRICGGKKRDGTCDV